MGRITKKVNNLGGYRELWKHYTLSWVYKPKNVFYGSSLTKLQPSWSLFNLQKVKAHVGIVMVLHSLVLMVVSAHLHLLSV